MYTTHGHHIPGTVQSYPIPNTKVLCDSVNKCFKCLGEAYHATLVWVSPEDKVRRVSLMDDVEKEMKARVIVANYYNNNRIGGGDELTLKEVHLVWFSKTLKNWKALITTDIPDNVYYEVTYNGAAKVAYLDVYKKTDNLVIQD